MKYLYWIKHKKKTPVNLIERIENMSEVLEILFFQIDRVLTNERGLRHMLSSALGMDNIAELAVQWFDSLGDGALDREEYFTMSKTINLEQLRKDANSDSNLESINQNSKEEL